MAKLKLKSTMDIAEDNNYTVLLYGEAGSGKTTFAHTWPAPVFLVPEMAENEMKSICDQDLPVVVFADMDDFYEQVKSLKKAIHKGQLLCRTLVVDNLTTIQQQFEDEIKQARGLDKLDWEEWGKFTSYFMKIKNELHKWPCHKIWITHTDEDRTFSLKGDSRKFFPNACDLLLYCEVVDTGKPGAAGIEYRVHGRRKAQWPARIRIPEAHERLKKFRTLGPNPSPHYDLLAPYLGLPLQKEAEEQFEAEYAAKELAK